MPSASRAVAIVGGSGFIGRAIAFQLSQAGHAITIFDIAHPGGNLGWDYIKFDLRDDIWSQVADQSFDLVVIAAGILAKGCNDDPEHAWGLNVTATRRFLESLASHQPGAAVVFLSSAMVYDARDSASPFIETSPTRGACVYTRSKLAVEASLAAYASRGLLSALVIRPFTVFGDGALAGDKGHLFGRWLERGLAGKNLIIYGDGSQILDAVAVERIANVCLVYLYQDPKDPFFVVNATGGGTFTLKRLAELFVQAGLARGFEHVPAPEGASARGWGDATTLLSLLGETYLKATEDEVAEFLASVGSVEAADR